MRCVCVMVLGVVCAVAQGQSGGVTSAAAVPAVAAGSNDAAKLAAAEKKLNDWAQLGRYAAENVELPATEARRVVFYGDSITDAWGRRPDTGTFFPGQPYVNRGISGQTTPQMLVRFRQDVVALKPWAVVILAGTNDVAGNTGPETDAMIHDNFRGMVEIARANGIRVILASVLPAAAYPWKPGIAPAQRIAALNAWLKGYCAEQKLMYLDYYSAMVGPDGGMRPGISFDGVHPNAAGYAVMTPLASAALAKQVRGK